MTISHSVRYTWTGQGGDTLSVLVTETGDGEDNRQVSVAPSDTNAQVDIDFAIARLQGIFVKADQVCVVMTNTTASGGDNSFTVGPTAPLAWQTSGQLANPFTVDVTSVYVQNTSTSATATVDIKLLQDSTP